MNRTRIAHGPLRLPSFARQAACALLAAASAALSPAATLIHNDGFNANNLALPGHPNYGSNVAESGPNWTATPGEWGVTGTPDIALHWDGQGGGNSGNGLDTYTDWDGRGNVVQIDGSGPAGTTGTFLTFTPAPGVAVHLASFDLDAWSGGGEMRVAWSVLDPADEILAEGVWTQDNAGGRDTISPAVTGSPGQALRLRLSRESGSAAYLALDQLAFDQQFVAVSEPSLSLDQISYPVGDPIVASFANGPGNAADWIGIYPEDITPSGAPASLVWSYTNGTQTAGGSLTEGTLSFASSGLGPGNYRAWFLADDGYTPLAAPVAFEVFSTETSEWLLERFRFPHAIVGQAYAGRVSAWASHAGPATVFSKSAGPEWLEISADGSLSGTPQPDDAGTHTFTLRLVNSANDSASEAEMELRVFPQDMENVRSLRLMTYNVWSGWGHIHDGYRKGIESIVLSQADVVGFQEADPSFATRVANDLGWHVAPGISGSPQIISRYPIVATEMAGIAGGARIRLASSPAREIWIFNCHLDHRFYGPYAAQLDGATEASVLQEEARANRHSQIQAVLAAMAARLEQADEAPVFLTGDFNVPSHLDWTAETAVIHHGVGPVGWPTSLAVAATGLIDSYRSVHPDPLADPADTWSPIFKGNEAQDRIDRIYHAGSAVRPVAAEVFTTAVEATTGTWGAPLGAAIDNTWPSDHAAVTVDFALGEVDADENGLSDVWEIEWFGETGKDPHWDANGDGLRLIDAFRHGLPPLGPPQRALSMNPEESPPTLRGRFSHRAIGSGLVVETSSTLATDSWQPLWSYDEDPDMEHDSIADLIERGDGAWELVFAGPDTAEIPRRFFRISSTSNDLSMP